MKNIKKTEGIIPSVGFSRPFSSHKPFPKTIIRNCFWCIIWQVSENVMKKNDSLYKLSPSDFAYLWNNCKYCYYQKIKFGVVYSSPFPAMFGRISSLLQTSIMGKNFKDVNPDLPSGIIEIQEGFMKSKPIPGTNTYLSGSTCFSSR